LLLLTVFSLPSAAETSLWKISGGDRTLYLGGTIHVLRESDYPLPTAYQRAFDEAGIIGFETDLRTIQDATFQSRLWAAARYPDGEDLSTHLSARARQALRSRSQKANIDLSALLPFKPAVVMLSLMHLELRRLGVTARGVDEYFMQQAETEGKPILGLESGDQQIRFLSELGVGFESEFVLHSLAEIEQLEPMLVEMIRMWRNGDNDGLEATFVTPLEQDYPGIYRSLLLERNRHWVPQLEALLQTSEVELVLVGVAHLPGVDGLLNQLRLRGYTVEQLPETANCPGGPADSPLHPCVD
jgi:uncharacterized protein YbaP (TraB family)